MRQILVFGGSRTLGNAALSVLPAGRQSRGNQVLSELNFLTEGKLYLRILILTISHLLYSIMETMSNAQSEPVPQSTDAYSAFLKDLEVKAPKILTDEQIRERIIITRASNATNEEKSAARNDVVESSLRLIPFVIKGLPHIGIQPEELVGQGFEVLNRCIDTWDINHVSPRTEERVRFSTYLVNSLEKGLRSQRTVAKVGDSIPTPDYIYGIANIMRRARELFLQEEHHEPSQDEWYKRTVKLAGESLSISSLKRITPEVFEATERSKLTASATFGRSVSRGNVHSDTLDLAIGDIESTLVDKDENTEMTAIDNATREAVEKQLHVALKSLTPTQRTVLVLRFGIGLDEKGEPRIPLTLDAIAKKFGHINRERVRQIESRALRTLRHPSRSQDIHNLINFFPDNADKLALERKIRQDVYGEMLKSLSTDFLITRDRERLIRSLAIIRNGREDNGQIDLELFRSIHIAGCTPEMLEQYENDFGTSPRIIVDDILDCINNTIYLLHHEHQIRGERGATRYWSMQPPITIDEVKAKCNEEAKKRNVPFSG